VSQFEIQLLFTVNSCQTILCDSYRLPFHHCQRIFRFFRKEASPYVPVPLVLAVSFCDDAAR
jgi:hypothetical protein